LIFFPRKKCQILLHFDIFGFQLATFCPNFVQNAKFSNYVRFVQNEFLASLSRDDVILILLKATIPLMHSKNLKDWLTIVLCCIVVVFQLQVTK